MKGYQSLGFIGVVALTSAAQAQVVNPAFGGCYDVRSLGTPANVPTALGGITFKPGDPNTILVGGGANGSGGAIYAVPVTRDLGGAINGFAGPGVLYSTAPNIDGGLAFGPGGVLFFTRYSTHAIGQIKPGSTVPDKSVSLVGSGIANSTGALQFVPPGYPGAGQLKVASYNAGTWHSVGYTPDGTGTYDFGPFSPALTISGGPEGIVYVQPGNPGFTQFSVLISEYSSGRVSAYEVDANGDPIVSTRRDFITGLSGAEGGTRDPATGHFLFSTFGGGNRILVVTGFNRGCPANLNGDCAIDDTDFVLFAQAYDVYDCSAPTMPQNCQADINQDGFVDDVDFVLFAQAYDGFLCQ